MTNAEQTNERTDETNEWIKGAAAAKDSRACNDRIDGDRVGSCWVGSVGW